MDNILAKASTMFRSNTIKANVHLRSILEINQKVKVTNIFFSTFKDEFFDFFRGFLFTIFIYKSVQP